jgi:hypothetical protein
MCQLAYGAGQRIPSPMIDQSVERHWRYGYYGKFFSEALFASVKTV